MSAYVQRGHYEPQQQQRGTACEGQDRRTRQLCIGRDTGPGMGGYQRAV